jgi:hypothetical protein
MFCHLDMKLPFSCARHLVLIGIITFTACCEPTTEWSTAGSAPPYVSLVEVISSKTTFHGRDIRLSGFLSLQDEACGLYLSKDDARYGLTKNGVWVGFSTNLLSAMDVMKFNNRYVTLAGRFDMHDRGHMGLWSGTVCEITALASMRAR